MTAKQDQTLAALLLRLEDVVTQLEQLFAPLVEAGTRANPGGKVRFSALANRGMRRRMASLARAAKNVGEGQGAVRTKATRARLRKEAE